MAPDEIKVRMVVTNAKSLRAVEVIAGVLSELKSDMPWRPEVQRACRAARYLIKHLDVVDCE